MEADNTQNDSDSECRPYHGSVGPAGGGHAELAGIGPQGRGAVVAKRGTMQALEGSSMACGSPWHQLDQSAATYRQDVPMHSYTM